MKDVTSSDINIITMIIVIATTIITKISHDTNKSRMIVTTTDVMILKFTLINLENMGIHLQ